MSSQELNYKKVPTILHYIYIYMIAWVYSSNIFSGQTFFTNNYLIGEYIYSLPHYIFFAYSIFILFIKWSVNPLLPRIPCIRVQMQAFRSVKVKIGPLTSKRLILNQSTRTSPESFFRIFKFIRSFFIVFKRV